MLTPSSRIGPYEVMEPLGAGGMGEVYRARDTRLERDVALKVLPPALAVDADRVMRFTREAKTLAALNHPHIAQIYGIEEASDVRALVMELVPGETLAERLLRGAPPLREALDLARQIADGLAAAHERGIVHRDLKPANIQVTPDGVVKILDFGVAKVLAASTDDDGPLPPTLLTQVTAPGSVVGTPAYMSPEQARGQVVDKRADVWAFGCVLFELLGGRRAFGGTTVPDILAAVLEREPDWDRLPAATPAAVRALAQRCLRKDPRQRLHDTADAKFVLEDALVRQPDDREDGAHDVAGGLRWIGQTSGTEAAPRRYGARVGLLAAAALAGVTVGIAGMWLARPAAPGVSVTRLSLDVHPAEELHSGGVSPLVQTPAGVRTAFAWTPDGRALVYVGQQGGRQQLYVRRLDEAEARPLANTEGARAVAVSADGRWVAFWAARTLRKVPFDGGPAMDLVTGLGVPVAGLTWDSVGRLFFDRVDDGRIWQVAPEGAVTAVTTLGDGELRHVLPWPLPGGNGLLYTVRKRAFTWDDDHVVAHVLATGERKRLVQDAADARYVRTGHLVFLRRGTLFATPFDAEHLEVRGPAVAVLDRVVQALTASNANDITGAGQFAISATGTMAVISGPVAPDPEANLVSLDRTGQVAPLPAPLRPYRGSIRLSPDGRHVALIIRGVIEQGLWLYAADRGVLSLLTEGGEVMWPRWSPDGRRLAFAWTKAGVPSIALQPADGSVPPEVLLRGDYFPSSWTPDGRHLAAVRRAGEDIVVVSAADGHVAAQPLGETPHREWWPEFSPDGRWLAYGSDVSGRFEVYVRPYPGPGAPHQVSIDGGVSPAWHPGGRELFFVGPPDEAGPPSISVADIDTRSSLRVGRPRTLFRFTPADLNISCVPVRCFDISPYGRQFYAVQHGPRQAPPPVTHVGLITNWFVELQAKVPSVR